MQVVRVEALDFHGHLDARAEPVDDRHQPVDGEAPEIGIADTGKVHCGNSGAGMRLPNRKTFTVERLDKGGKQTRS